MMILSHVMSTEPRLRLLALLATTAITLTAAPAFAQTQPAEEAQPSIGGAAPASNGAAAEETEVEELVVTASGRPYGSVIGDVPPEITLNPAEIRATGATSVSELISVLSAELQSGTNTGAPIVLLNGRRIPSQRDISSLPTEAVLRSEILPEEVASKYGFRPDQKVLNIVLRPRFRATAVEAKGGAATQGGRETGQFNLANFRINRDNLYLFDGQVSGTAGVLESDRGIAQASSRFDLLGNVSGTGPGGEIDPALSSLLGRTITQAPAPAAAAIGPVGLGQFALGAGGFNSTDIGRYRTARGNGDEAAFAINGTVTRPVFGTYTAFNARFEGNSEETLLGLPSLTLSLPSGNPYSPFSRSTTVSRYVDTYGPLRQTQQTQAAHLGAAASNVLPWGDWRWQFSGNLDRRRSLTETDRGVDPALIQAGLNARDPAVNPFGPFGSSLARLRPRDESLSVRTTGDAQFTASGTFGDLPAGGVRTSVTAALDAQLQERETVRSGVRDEAELNRQRGRLTADFDVPLLRRGDVGSFGDLTLNLNGEVEQYSDFGTLTALEYGFRWSPVRRMNLTVSMRQEDNAPSLEQLGNPTIFTPLVQVFDFTRGETVEVTRITGGNSNLDAESRRRLQLRFFWQPWQSQNLRLFADYQRDRRKNFIGSFGDVTAEIEAAFPERFVRDASGRLITYDVRPVNFARREQEQVGWGFNYSRFVRSQPPAGQGQQAPGQGQGQGRGQGQGGQGPGGQGGFRGPGQGGFGPGGPGSGGAFGGFGGFGGGGGFGGTMMQISLRHSYTLEDSRVIREGVPALDFLEGVGGRTPRHQVSGRASITHRGLGASLQGNWRSSSVARGGTLVVPRDLFFEDFSSLNANLWFDAGARPDLVRKYRWLRGARVGLEINNVFDTREQVRDEDGTTPLNYQPDLIDPVGRTFQVSFRKLFLPARPVRARQGQGGGQGGSGGFGPGGQNAGPRQGGQASPAAPGPAPQATPPASAPGA